MRYVFVTLAVCVALATVAVVTPAAPAGSCAAPVVRQVVKQQIVATPAVITPVVQNVVVAQFVAVPVVVPLFAVGYDPVSYGITEELRAIREELRLTRQALTAPPPAGPQEPSVLPQKDNPAQPLESGIPPHQQILAHHCAACHTAGSAKGGVTIFSEPGKLNLSVNKLALWDAAEKQEMPPGDKPKVHPDDLKILREWARGKGK